MTERNEKCSCGSGKKYKKCCGMNMTKGGKNITIIKNDISMPLRKFNPFLYDAEKYHDELAKRMESK